MEPRMSEVPFRIVRRSLEHHGWTLDRIKGSHHVFTKEGEPQPLVIPVHNGRIKPVYIRQIKKALGIDIG